MKNGVLINSGNLSESNCRVAARRAVFPSPPLSVRKKWNFPCCWNVIDPKLAVRWLWAIAALVNLQLSGAGWFAVRKSQLSPDFQQRSQWSRHYERCCSPERTTKNFLATKKVPMVDLREPTEDRVCGTIRCEKSLKVKALNRDHLAKANRGISRRWSQLLDDHW